VYCKECIAKIKAGELRPIKSSPSQVKQDESKFFKPLSDLGIEYPSADYNSSEAKNTKENKPPLKTNTEARNNFSNPRNLNSQNMPKGQGVMGAIKNAFVKKPHDSGGLKDILNKALSEKQITEVPAHKPNPINTSTDKKDETPVISLADLKRDQPKVGNPTDRSANADAMNSLKSLLNKINDVPVQKPEPIVDNPEPVVKNPEPVKISPEIKQEIPIQESKPKEIKEEALKEVPEEVLKKILNEENN